MKRQIDNFATRFSRSEIARAALAACLVAALTLLPAVRYAHAAPADDVVEPLAGRDFTMRYEPATGRFERFGGDVTLAESVTLATSRAAPGPGLWLAVPSTEAAGHIVLLPLGLTAGQAIDGGLDADLAARLAAQGGGVLFVDDGTAAPVGGRAAVAAKEP
jgi:hypothetical protein